MRRISASLLVCLCVTLVTPFLGHPASAETGPRIVSLVVRGNRQIESSAILATIESRVGMTFSPDRTRRDILALYRMGVFHDIQIEREEVSDGIRLIYLVTEKSRIARISFEGNKKVKEEKLRELLEIRAPGSGDPKKLAQTIEKIGQHYREEGYHLAQVRPEYRPIEGSEDQELVFQIVEGKEARIGRVHFIGNRAFSDRELRKLLKNKARGYWSWLTGRGKYQEEVLKRDVAVLTYHYQNHGYLKVEVQPPRVSLTRDRKWIHLTFHVAEGLQYRVGIVEVDGEILTTREEMISKLKIKPNRIYARKDLEEDLQYFSQAYGDQGYAYASIQPILRPNDEKRTVDILYTLRRGPRVTIERINISGNTVTRDKVIRREMLVKENSLYHETRLKLSKQRIEALGYFEEVNFATPRGSADDQIVLNITVKEKPTGQFAIGAGFSSAESFIFTASVSKQNFFGFGISGQLMTELSSLRQLFMLSFEDPYFLDSDWILGVSGYRTVNVFSDFDRRSFGGSLTLGHRIFDNSIFRFRYEAEDVSVGDFRTTVPTAFRGNLSGLTSSLGLSLQRDTRNNRIFPTKGIYQSLSAEFAGVGGDNEFYRLTENLRLFYPIWKGFVGKFNFTMAQVSSLNNRPVPLFERYFLGGVNSLRGYFLRNIGPAVQIPQTPSGGDSRFVIGGNKMLQYNLELEIPLYDPAGFKLVSFFDAGNAFSEEENFSLTDIRMDYGFGLRWNSPFGPLRFEWGIPIGRLPGEDPVIFNFTIGSFF